MGRAFARKLRAARKTDALRAKIWHKRRVLDSFDLSLLNAVQRDDSRTADSLAREVPLSPSAIARTIALISPRLAQDRLRALVFIQLSEHANLTGKSALQARLGHAPQVQFCYETTGAHDMLALFDCASMAEFNELCDALLAPDSMVQRYETSFVKREVKFAPFVELRAPAGH